MSPARLAVAWIVLAQAGCACASAPEECAPNDERACSAASACRATEVCVAGQWGPCECESAAGGSGGAPTGAPALPSECASDGECPDNAACLDDSGGGALDQAPAPGICVAECTADPGVCAEFADSLCVKNSEDSSYCVAGCELGVADAGKCGERADIACHPTDTGAGYCKPICTRHDQCDVSCNPRSGNCALSVAEPFDAFGQACDPDSSETCSGTCIEVEPDYAVCTNPCVFGSADPCAIDAAAPSLCAIVTPGGSIGDLGYCAQLCDCNEECAHPGAVCDPFGEPSVAEWVGHQGVCAASVTESGLVRAGLPCGSQG